MTAMPTLAERLARETDHTPPLDRDGRPIYSTADDDANPLDAVRMSGRTLWSPADAKHVFALDQAADAILRDDALLRVGTDAIADTLTGEQGDNADAQLRHAVRDELRSHGIAVDITGLRPSRRVGSGRSARAIPGGYVERQYSQTVSAPNVSARQLAAMTWAERAELEAMSAYCHDARHTSDLGEFLSATSVDVRRFAPTHERKSHGVKLDWTPRLKIRSPRRIVDATIVKRAGRVPWELPDTRDGVNLVRDIVPYVWPADRPVRTGERPNYIVVDATVTELPGPWLDAEHVTYGHRVVYVPRKSTRGKRNRSETIAPPATVEMVRDAVRAVLASRKRKSIVVLGRTVVLVPAKRGTVRWETSSKQGQGSSPPAVAGRIIASVAK